MADEHPILRSLVDSLTAINQRLNIIENALNIPSDTAPAQRQSASSSNAFGNAGRSMRSLPLSDRLSFVDITTTTAAHSLPSPPGHAVHDSSQLASTSQPLPFYSQITKRNPPAATVPMIYAATTQPSVKRKLFEEPSPDCIPKRLKIDTELSEEDIECVEGEERIEEIGDVEDEEQEGAGSYSSNNGQDADSVRLLLPKHLQPTGIGQSSLEALPEGFLVSGRATLQEELDGWTIPRGYSMRINGTRSHGRRQKIRMVCFRGGRSRLRPKDEEPKRDEIEAEPQQQQLFADDAAPAGATATTNSRRRKPTTDRISKKCECPFRFELVEVSPAADRYTVHYTNEDHMQHNHAAADLMLDPRARKLPQALKAEVDQWLRGASSSSSTSSAGGAAAAEASSGTRTPGATGWTIAKIQAELQRRGYGHVLDFDLRNRKRALLHKERMAQLKKQEEAGDGSTS